MFHFPFVQLVNADVLMVSPDQTAKLAHQMLLDGILDIQCACQLVVVLLIGNVPTFHIPIVTMDSTANVLQDSLVLVALLATLQPLFNGPTEDQVANNTYYYTTNSF